MMRNCAVNTYVVWWTHSFGLKERSTHLLQSNREFDYPAKVVDHMVWLASYVLIALGIISVSQDLAIINKSFTYIVNNQGPRMLLCRNPNLI